MPTVAPPPLKPKPKLPPSYGVLFLKGEDDGSTEAITVPVLLFVEGSHTDANGKEGSYDTKALSKIVEATQKYFAAGNDIWFFESDHDLTAPYLNANKIGKLDVSRGLEVREITEDTLPDPRLTDLIGKQGIFGYVKITRSDAVERYRQELIKPISIAFDPSGGWTEGHKWAIFELSAVSWGAVKGAMLFSRRRPEMLDKPQVFALTIDGQMAEWDSPWDMRFESVFRVTEAFQSVIRNILGTTDEELMGRDRAELIRSAVSDLATRLEQSLGVAQVAPSAPPTVPVLNSKRLEETSMQDEPVLPTQDAPTPTEGPTTAELLARIEALETKASTAETRAESAEQELAVLQHERKVSDRVQHLQQWAQKLVQQGKLTPAAYSKWFEEGKTHAQHVALFSKPQEGVPSLDKIEAQLEFADGLEPVQFGSVVKGSTPLGGNPYQEQELTDTDKAQAAEVARDVVSRRPY